jgi:hypothetical protein
MKQLKTLGIFLVFALNSLSTSAQTLGVDEEVFLFDGQTLVCAPSGFETLDGAKTDRYFAFDEENEDGIAAVITILSSSTVGVLYSNGTASFVESPHRIHFATLYNNKVVVDGPDAMYYFSTFSEVEGTNGLFSSDEFTKKVMSVIDGRIYAADYGVPGFKYLEDTIIEVATPLEFWEVNNFISFNDKIVIANQNRLWEFDPATHAVNLFPGSDLLVNSGNVYPSDAGIYVVGISNSIEIGLKTVLHYISQTYEWNDQIVVVGGQVSTFENHDYWVGSVPEASETLWQVEQSKESLRKVVFNNNLEVYGYVYTEEKLYGLPGAFFGNPFYADVLLWLQRSTWMLPNKQLVFSVVRRTDVQVYPNPASDILTVEVENLSGVRVFSLFGQEFNVPTSYRGN